ncbi:YciY family protein [Mixta gaviniae]|uniref:YciY family protein n=1 Tax=Mixta gaviniae TaxID=665914 RepID=UPI0010085BC4|nr:YciY family protein [Mixta gaviniae]
MKRSKNEVARWRMLRQAQRKRARWLEGQSRRYRRIHAFRHQLDQQQRRSVLFINQFW